MASMEHYGNGTHLPENLKGMPALFITDMVLIPTKRKTKLKKVQPIPILNIEI